MTRQRRSVVELAHCASSHLEKYCSPLSRFGWPDYDIDPAPGRLVPGDLLAPAWLSYPIPPRYLQYMSANDGNAYRRLRDAMADVVETATGDESFLDLDEAAITTGVGEKATSGWKAFWNAWNQVGQTKGVTSVALTKILHRKVPELIPILDSLVSGFYGISNHSRERGVRTMLALHRDLLANHEIVDGWRNRLATENVPTMSLLRAVDIVIWTHQYTDCSGN